MHAIKLEEQEDYFIGLLEEESVNTNNIEEKAHKVHGEDIVDLKGKKTIIKKEEEIYKALEKIKEKKAPGIDFLWKHRCSEVWL